MPGTDPEWMTSKEACAYLGINSATLYKFINEGLLVAHRSRRFVRISHEDADAFISRARIKPGELGHLSLRRFA